MMIPKLNIVIKHMQELINVTKKERYFILHGTLNDTGKLLKFEWKVPGETIKEKVQLFYSLVDYLIALEDEKENNFNVLVDIKEFEESQNFIRLINDPDYLIKVIDIETSNGVNIKELLLQTNKNEGNEEIQSLNHNTDPEQLEQSETENDNKLNDLNEEQSHDEIDHSETPNLEVSPENSEDVDSEIIEEETNERVTEDLKVLYDTIQYTDDYNSSSLNTFVDAVIEKDSEIKNLFKVIVLNSTVIKDSYTEFLKKFKTLQEVGPREEINLFTKYNGTGISNHYIKAKYIEIMTELRTTYEDKAIEDAIQKIYTLLMNTEEQNND